jgi:hypothetical protein
MSLSDLAGRVYEILRGRVPAADPRLSYGQLVHLLGPLPSPNEGLTPSDPRLFAALGEICRACHSHNPRLAALSCIVVRKQEDGTLGTPGAGYYYEAHAGVHGDQAKHAAWLEEFEQAKRTTYPTSL